MEIRNPRGLAVGRPVIELARWLAGTLAGSLLLLAAGVLCWRSLAGALNSPLGPVALVVVGVATAAAAATVRACWGGSISISRATAMFDRLLAAGISATVLAVGVALSLPDSSMVGLVAFWCLLIAGECWAWLPLTGRPSIWRTPFRTTATPLPPVADRAIRVDSAEIPSPHVATALAELPNRNVTQQLVRSQSIDGSEELAGWIRVDLTPGQRLASVHLAFCPPFPRTPELAVEQLDGPAGKLKTVQLLPYGTRFDLKLAHTLEDPATVLLRFSARLKSEAEAE